MLTKFDKIQKEIAQTVIQCKSTQILCRPELPARLKRADRVQKVDNIE